MRVARTAKLKDSASLQCDEVLSDPNEDDEEEPTATGSAEGKNTVSQLYRDQETALYSFLAGFFETAVAAGLRHGMS